MQVFYLINTLGFMEIVNAQSLFFDLRIWEIFFTQYLENELFYLCLDFFLIICLYTP